MDSVYKKISLNLFDPNVIGGFRTKELKDGSVVFIRYKDECAGAVHFKKIYDGYKGEQIFQIICDRENRYIECMIQLIRTSHNCYILMGSTEEKTHYERVASIKEVNDYIKANFCRTLLTENDNEKEV